MAVKLSGRPLVFLVVASGLLSFLLFGYDQGVMGGLINGRDFLRTFPSLETNSNLLGTVVAVYEVGCFFGSIAASIWGNKLGRRRSIMLGSLLVLIGGALQSASQNVPMLIVFRVLTGFGLGINTSMSPMYVAECVRPKHRGMLVNLELVGAGIGISISYWLNYGMSFVHSMPAAQWRFPMAFQCVFPITLLALYLLVLPESPRWLADRGRYSEAHAIMTRLTTEAEAEVVIRDIRQAIKLEYELVSAAQGKTQEREKSKEQSYWACFQSNKQCFRYRTLLGLGCLSMMKLTGVDVVVYYQAFLFEKNVGLSHNLSLLLAGINSVQSLFWIIGAGFWLIDRVGRVRLMWISSALEAVCMAILAGTVGRAGSRASGIVSAVFVFVFFGIHSGGWLGPSWLYPAEISPLAIRHQVASLASASCWMWNFVVAEITPTALARIQSRYFIVWAVLNAVQVPILYFLYPETAHLKLEEVDELFADGKVNVRRSPRAVLGGRQILQHDDDHVRAEAGMGKVARAGPSEALEEGDGDKAEAKS